MQPNGAQQIQQWLNGYTATQILITSDSLGLFEAFRDGSRELTELAAALKLPVDSLERLLIATTAMGLTRRQGQEFSLTALARTYLLRGEQYAGGMFHHIKHHLYPLWHYLEEGVRENRPQWNKLPGKQEGAFASMYADPRALEGFMEAMFSNTYAATCQMVEQNPFDFGQFRQVVDAGGAAGGFLIPLLRKYPHLQGTIFDLAPVEPIARAYAARFGLAGRLQFVPGDFFQDPLPRPGGSEADLFVLGHILHDWNREDGTRLLAKIHATLPAGGAVCVNEYFLQPGKDGPLMPACLNLTMLVATQGQERTAGEYEEWLRAVGFRRTESWQDERARGIVIGWKDRGGR